MVLPRRYVEAEASGSKIKRVECEKCDAVYTYLLKRAGSTMVKQTPFGGDAHEKATRQANERLGKFLDEGEDLAPCPTCGHYQRSMIKRFRRDVIHTSWAYPLGAWIVIFIGSLLMQGLVQKGMIGVNYGFYVGGLACLLTPVWFVGVVVFTLVYNPNRMPLLFIKVPPIQLVKAGRLPDGGERTLTEARAIARAKAAAIRKAGGSAQDVLNAWPEGSSAESSAVSAGEEAVTSSFFTEEAAEGDGGDAAEEEEVVTGTVVEEDEEYVAQPVAEPERPVARPAVTARGTRASAAPSAKAPEQRAAASPSRKTTPPPSSSPQRGVRATPTPAAEAAASAKAGGGSGAEERVKLQCPECNADYRVPVRLLGRKGICRHCGAKFVMAG